MPDERIPQRARVPRLAAAAILVGGCGVLSGCGVDPTGPANVGKAPVATASAQSIAPVYFWLKGKLVPVPRPLVRTDPDQVLHVLMNGPTAAERARGIRTELTPVKQLLVVEKPRQIVELSTVPPHSLTQAGYAQIYCTGQHLAIDLLMQVSRNAVRFKKPNLAPCQSLAASAP